MVMHENTYIIFFHAFQPVVTGHLIKFATHMQNVLKCVITETQMHESSKRLMGAYAAIN